MKIPSQKKMLVSSVLLLGLALVAPVRAADEKSETASERKAHREAEVLKKYDANHDGRLDDTEKAAKKADKDRIRAERDAKKREKEEKKTEQDDR